MTRSARATTSPCSAAATPALCAALTAREAGASVIVLECAPRHFRGGNSRHTRNLRCAHAAPTDVLTGAYSEDEFLADLLRVTGNETDEALARLVVSASAECPAWMQRHGVRFQSSLRGTLHLARTNAFFLGGGKALMNSYYAAAERLGIDVLLRRRGRRRSTSTDGRFAAATVRDRRRAPRRSARAPWCSRPAASRRTSSGCARPGATRPTTSSSAARRTTPARCCRLMLDAGAQPVGDPRAVPRRRGRRPRAEVRRRHRHAARLRAARHRRQHATASGSTTRARTSGRSATRSGAGSSRASRIRSRISIVDAKAIGRFMPSVFPPIVARVDPRARGACSACRPDALERDRRRVQRARCGPARSTTRCSTTAGPRDSTPAKTPLGAADRHAAVLGLSAAARHHVHLSRRARSTSARAC